MFQLNFNSAALFAYIIVAGILGILVNFTVILLERTIITWKGH